LDLRQPTRSGPEESDNEHAPDGEATRTFD
jgi:hypothetical protein